MKNKNKEQTEEFIEFAKKFTIATSSNEFIFSFFGISFASLMLFGLSFLLISLGLIAGLWLMALAFDPTYQLFRKLFHLKNLPLHLVKPPLPRIIFLCIMFAFPCYLVFIGIQVLLGAFGPLNFSLIYELIRFFFFR